MLHDNADEIFEAIRRGHIESLRPNLQTPKDANRTDAWGQHPLVLAAALGRTELVECLLDHGADVDACSGSTDSNASPPELESNRVQYLLHGHPEGDELPDRYCTALETLTQFEIPFEEAVAQIVDQPIRPETENESALAAACRNGHEDVVALLLTRGASTKAQEWNQTPALVCAVERGCPAIVRKLLLAGACPNTSFDISPLMAAAMEGKTAVLKQLLRAGAEPDLADDEGYTPLMAAAARGSLEAVECLVEAGADCNASAAGIDPLLCAADGGHNEVYDFLLARSSAETQSACNANRINPVPIGSLHGSRAVSQADRMRQSDFLASAMVGDLPGLREGIQNGVSIDVVGPEGYTALMYAASNGHAQLVDFLVESGAEMDRPASLGSADAQVAWAGMYGRDSGTTALGLVAGSCFCPDRPAMVRRLVEAGAEVDAADSAGLTPLLRAASQAMLDSCQTLIELGADLDACDHEGNTAFMLAHLCGNEALQALLREAGASEAGIEHVRLCDAVESGDVESVRKLLESGADVNHRGDTTPLVLAVGTRNRRLVDLLLEAGADPNRPAEPGGFTAIARAAYGGDASLVKRLLEAGADPFIPVLASYDAIQYARLGAAEGRGDGASFVEIESMMQRKAG